MDKRNKAVFLLIVNVCVLVALVSAAAVMNQSVNTFSAYENLNNRSCVIIDAGHGGFDGGAVSCTGVSESQFNLEIALRLKDLMNLIGIHTKLVRDSDVSVYTKGESIAAKKVSDLKNRVDLVNNTERAVLISIHQNHFSDSRYSGAQVFYGDTEESALFGKDLQKSLVVSLDPANRRQAKKASGVYLMEKISCPAVLVECGFLSNHQEEALLKDPIYQKKLCAVIAVETATYLNNLHTA